MSGKLISAPGKSFYKMIDNHEVRYAIGCRRPLYWPHSGRRCAAFAQSLPSPRKGKTKIKRWFHCEIRTQSFGVESKLTRKGKGEGWMEGGKRERDADCNSPKIRLPAGRACTCGRVTGQPNRFPRDPSLLGSSGSSPVCGEFVWEEEEEWGERGRKGGVERALRAPSAPAGPGIHHLFLSRFRTNTAMKGNRTRKEGTA